MNIDKIQCDILGVKINVTNIKQTLKIINQNLKNIQGKYICVSNVHTTVMSYENYEYREIQNKSYMSLPDGKPLSIISRIKGYKNAARVTGPDLMEEVFKISIENSYTHYFYGSTDETLSTLKKILNEKYPSIKIAGMYSPPFRELTEKEDEDVIKNINSAKPDFIWVGLGAPKQEIWMKNHENKVKGLMIGVGAGFDYHAEKIKRAPKWMQNLSLEWLYRLIQDPKRLFNRYITTNTKFIFYIIQNYFFNRGNLCKK